MCKINKTINNIAQTDECPEFEFHILKEVRDKYQFEDKLFSIKGDVVFSNFNGSKQIADILNRVNPKKTVYASHINALGLIEEIMHYMIEQYRTKKNPKMFDNLENYLKKEFSEDDLDKLLFNFADLFPTTEIYKNKTTAIEYLKNKTANLSNRHVVLEEMIVLWLDNVNPVYKPINELINDRLLDKKSIYSKVFSKIDDFFDEEPPAMYKNMPLMQMLLLPSRKFPNSITAQLEFIRAEWGHLLGDLLVRLLKSLDFIKEDEKIRFGHGPGPINVPDFSNVEDIERFSADKDWMPKLVLIAKTSYVWLDQLSKEYEKPITRLDQIPDSELDRLANFGFTGLWLIGIWERSKASEKIKKIKGNQEAVASAYSLEDYVIANALGGEEAYQNLAKRAWDRGIRLASDMVPNHMGLDSKWLINNPDWFIQSDYSPFPSYSFTGPDLSEDPRVGIYIEDGYWNHTDAAVVFKRHDRYTGDIKYVYHGNDGTSMPWNDTAQLNYLIPEVREAVIQTILHVARKFPIIRFDAAMTLAKKHYQRLWFPEPGTGGDIASRSEHGLSSEEFHKVFPEEFWREVVDRIHKEVPDTLLLAEAFWMMESYFVRTLGMHRVYNSAFMHMFKNEDNQKYRHLMKNVLAFNPQILQRYVNFMNNPDEDTAIAQFGKDDKYFGTCIMMATLPGLPMFGHGQIEGYSEKYGMEYRKAYWDENPDQWLVERHEKEVVPILKKRYLFSSVDNFLLYDLLDYNGHVNENVFAFSNKAGHEKSLTVYNNKFADASGWLKMSTSYKDPSNGLVQKSLADGLELSFKDNAFIVFRDYVSGLEFIRSCKDLHENGFYVNLNAFKYHVFMDFQEVYDSEKDPYAQICSELNGSGLDSVFDLVKETKIKPIVESIRSIINKEKVTLYIKEISDKKTNDDFYYTYRNDIKIMLDNISDFLGESKLENIEIDNIIQMYEVLIDLPETLDKFEGINTECLTFINDEFLRLPVSEHFANWRFLTIFPFVKCLYELFYDTNINLFLDDWFIGKYLFTTLNELNKNDKSQSHLDIQMLKILLSFNDSMVLDKKIPDSAYIDNLFSNETIQEFTGLNYFEEKVYFKSESFDCLMKWYFILSVSNYIYNKKITKTNLVKYINNSYKTITTFIKKAKENNYELNCFIESLR